MYLYLTDDEEEPTSSRRPGLRATTSQAQLPTLSHTGHSGHTSYLTAPQTTTATEDDVSSMEIGAIMPERFHGGGGRAQAPVACLSAACALCCLRSLFLRMCLVSFLSLLFPCASAHNAALFVS